MIAMLGLSGAVVLCAAGWGIWSRGYQAGVAAEILRQDKVRQHRQQDLFRLADQLSQRETELEIYRHAQQIHAQALEEAARADPDSTRPGISYDGLQRLERRWRPAP
ncbi:hypothetical protein [Tritonibacter scottomollicae]|uniref:hypothetical protein n=1 Tax=Tritonibacter scottomollicae TaxID=483013 RepID=UPI003AA82049